VSIKGQDLGRKRDAGKSSCKLCGQERKLCKSHIIPEFMYSLVYDPSPKRFYVLPANSNEKVQILQKGIRERLLCQECESNLSAFETYAKKVLLDEADSNPLVSDDDKVIQYKNINYKEFKLFQLSILWRASVSKLKFFSQVNLGPYEGKIQQMLLKRDPGLPDQYPCLIVGLLFDDKPFHIMRSPLRTRFGRHYCYMFVMSGLVWLFGVPRLELPDILSQYKDCIINQNGQIKVQWTDATKDILQPSPRNLGRKAGLIMK